jgi:hypothetical protein
LNFLNFDPESGDPLIDIDYSEGYPVPIYGKKICGLNLQQYEALSMTTIDQTQAQLNTHEQVCAFRYESICARMKRLESVGMTAAVRSLCC